MIRRTYIIGILAMGLTAATAVQTAPMVSRFVSSAQSFHSYFQDLKQSGATGNSLERFVFSLILAQPRTESAPHAVQAPRVREVQNQGGAVQRHT